MFEKQNELYVTDYSPQERVQSHVIPLVNSSVHRSSSLFPSTHPYSFLLLALFQRPCSCPPFIFRLPPNLNASLVPSAGTKYSSKSNPEPNP